jgi:DNA-binding response OmpR family regulator
MNQVWLVDDDQEMCQAIGLMLSLLDCQTRFFANSRQVARTLLAGETPDLLLLDINMPEVTGLDLLEFIRRRKTWNRLPIVMISAESTDVDIDHAKLLGATAYLVKPVSFKELENVTRQVLPNKPKEPR